MVEHRSEKPGVASSILAPATTFLKILAAALLSLLSVAGSAEEAAAPAWRARNAGAIDWKASGSLPPGAEYHLIYEEPKSHAVQTLVRMPKGYSLPKHSHAHDETILVLRGKVILDFGTKTETIAAGGYAVIPAGTEFALKVGGFGGADFFCAFAGPFDMKGLEKSR